MNRHLWRLVFLIPLLWLGDIQIASASLSDAVNALNTGDQYRVMFRTSSLHMRDGAPLWNHIADYDATVQGAADAGSVTNSLGLSWQAVVSLEEGFSSGDYISARDHITALPSADPIYIFRTDGALIANSYSDLWDGTISAYMSIDENGSDAISANVWTGTTSAGLADYEHAVYDHTLSELLFGAIGSPFDDDFRWINNNSTREFDTPLHLYAISELVTVDPVPVPTTMLLLGSGLIGLAGFRRKNKKT
jgi:hypothetical protein